MTGMVAALDGVHVEMNTGARIRKLADVRASRQSLPARLLLRRHARAPGRRCRSTTSLSSTGWAKSSAGAPPRSRARACARAGA